MHFSGICSLTAALSLLFAGSTLAQDLPSPESLLSGAEEQGTLMSQYRDILRNPDADIRHSAFMKLAVVEDPLVRQMAYDEAFSAADASMRMLALRFSLFDRENIVVEFPGTDLPPKSYRLLERNYSNGEFLAQSGPRSLGRVQGLQVVIQYNLCVLELVLNDDDALIGEQICADEKLPIKVNLRGI